MANETMGIPRAAASSLAPTHQRCEGAERRPSFSVQPQGDSLEERESFSDSGETGQRCCFVRCMVSIYDFFASIFRCLFGKAENPSTDPKETQSDSDPAQEMQEIEHPNEVELSKSEEPLASAPLTTPVKKPEPIVTMQLPTLEREIAASFVKQYQNNGFQVILAKELFKAASGRTQDWILYYMAKGKHFEDVDRYLYEIEPMPHDAFFKEYGNNQLFNWLNGAESVTEGEATLMQTIFAEGLPRQAKVAASSEPPIVQELRNAIKKADYGCLDDNREKFEELDKGVQVQLLYELASSQSSISPELTDIVFKYNLRLDKAYYFNVEEAMGISCFNYENSDIPTLATILKTLFNVE